MLARLNSTVQLAVGGSLLIKMGREGDATHFKHRKLQNNTCLIPVSIYNVRSLKGKHEVDVFLPTWFSFFF
jgi:hypothetical protein